MMSPIFAESLTHEKRMDWIAALDKVESLKPKVVIAGHKRETNSDGPTSSKIRANTFETSTDLSMRRRLPRIIQRDAQLYPDRLNPALWGSARALKG